MSKTRVIGVLGIDATVRQPYVDRLSAEFASDCLVLRHGSARLVELAEAKLRGGAAAPAEYRAALEGLIIKPGGDRSAEHTSELQSLMRDSYAVFCLKKNNKSPNCMTA